MVGRNGLVECKTSKALHKYTVHARPALMSLHECCAIFTREAPRDDERKHTHTHTHKHTQVHVGVCRLIKGRHYGGAGSA